MLARIYLARGRSMIQYTSRCFYSQCLFYLKNKTKVKLNYDGYTCPGVPSPNSQEIQSFCPSEHSRYMRERNFDVIPSNNLTLFIKFSTENVHNFFPILISISNMMKQCSWFSSTFILTLQYII